MSRLIISLLVLTGSVVAPVRAQDSRGPATLKELVTRFREVQRKSGGIPTKAVRLSILRTVARLGAENGMQFMADVLRNPRHADLEGEILHLLAKVNPESGVAAAVFRDRLGPTDPHRRIACDFLMRRAVKKRDNAWLTRMFTAGSTEDRFLALEAMGSIGSSYTLRSAWALFRDRAWKPKAGTVVVCSTIVRSLRAFEGKETARLLLLLRRDKRFRSEDEPSLREATRLWASANLRSYVKISDLADPDPERRAESARFMGAARFDAARAPLLFLATNASEPADVRAAAAEALGGLTIARGALARDLARLLTDSRVSVRLAAVTGLARLRVKAAVRALMSVFGTPLERPARAALAYTYDKDTHDWEAWLRTCGLPEGT